MRRQRPLTVCLSVLMTAAACAADARAGEVYQWTDANGVTHYSQTPPPGGGAKYRVISHRQPEAQAPVAAAAEDPQCGVARANIALIEGGGRVQRDTDGDGAPDRDLTQAERESQLQLARVVLRANCTPATQVATAAQDSASSEAVGAEEDASEGEQ